MKKNKKNQKEAFFPNLNFSAEWSDGNGTAGVDASSLGINWWYRPNGPGGRFGELGALQTLDEFLMQGPMGVPVPQKVMLELQTKLKEQGVKIPYLEKPQSAETILKKKQHKSDPASTDETKEIERYLDWFEKKDTAD